MRRGGRLGSSRLKMYTYIQTRCKICDREVSSYYINTHFRRSHPDVYYNEYPDRVGSKTIAEEVQ